MNDITLICSSIKISYFNLTQFKSFAQRMLNRLAVGELRYGSGDVSQKYLTRMKKEIHAYSKSGNQEQLLNIANYALLEAMYPENKRAHFDASTKSVTRKKNKIEKD